MAPGREDDHKKARPSTVRSDEWPAWFSFWFSGCWRALSKGTAWAGFVVFFRPSRGGLSAIWHQAEKTTTRTRNARSEIAGSAGRRCGSSLLAEAVPRLVVMMN